jgi:hypothetical protein
MESKFGWTDTDLSISLKDVLVHKSNQQQQQTIFSNQPIQSPTPQLQEISITRNEEINSNVGLGFQGRLREATRRRGGGKNQVPKSHRTNFGNEEGKKVGHLRCARYAAERRVRPRRRRWRRRLRRLLLLRPAARGQRRPTAGGPRWGTTPFVIPSRTTSSASTSRSKERAWKDWI